MSNYLKDYFKGNPKWQLVYMSSSQIRIRCSLIIWWIVTLLSSRSYSKCLLEMICAEIKLGFTDGAQGQVETAIKSSTFDDSLFECDGDLFFLSSFLQIPRFILGR